MNDIDWAAVGAIAIGILAFLAEGVRCRVFRARGVVAEQWGDVLFVLCQAMTLLGAGWLITDLGYYVATHASLAVFFLFVALWLGMLLAIAAVVDRRSGARAGRGRALRPTARGRS